MSPQIKQLPVIETTYCPILGQRIWIGLKPLPFRPSKVTPRPEQTKPKAIKRLIKISTFQRKGRKH